MEKHNGLDGFIWDNHGIHPKRPCNYQLRGDVNTHVDHKEKRTHTHQLYNVGPHFDSVQLTVIHEYLHNIWNMTGDMWFYNPLYPLLFIITISSSDIH